MKNNLKALSGIYWLLIITLVIKLLLIPFSQTVDADAVSRIYLSVNWIKDAQWINSSVWAPLHFYLNGMGLMLWHDPVNLPKVINVLLSSLTLIPFYFFTKREFNKEGALAATIFLAVCPILFRNSFMALAGTPYLFFLVLAMNFLSRGLKRDSVTDMLIAGFSITLASGFRYEAWLMIAVFGLVILLHKKWKLLFIYGSAALVFPLVWMISNWLETGDPLYSIQGNYHWTLNVMGINENVDFESYLRRIWYYPFSWMIALGPPAAFVSIRSVINTYSKKGSNRSLVIWTLPFWIMLLFFLYNSIKGVLLMQHRFSGTLVVLSLPFVAIFFREFTPVKRRLIWLFAAITLILSFLYNTSGVKPLPRLKDQTTVSISEIIRDQLNNESCLILDFTGWDETYYLALHSGLPQERIVITDGAKNSELPMDKIRSRIEKHREGLILLARNSELKQELLPKDNESSMIINGRQLPIRPLFRNDNMMLIEWRKPSE